jgi:hypothetical protein
MNMDHFTILKFPFWYGGPDRCYTCEKEIKTKGKEPYYSVRWTRKSKKPSTLRTLDTCSPECAEMAILKNL